MSAASLSIAHFRWRTDTVAVDGTPVYGAAVDTNWNINNATGFMVVFCVQNAGTTASSATTVKLQVSRNGGAFADVTTSSTSAVTANVSSSADQTTVAVSEVAGTGSYGAGLYSEIGTTGTGITVLASGYTNFVYGISLNATQLLNKETLQFKIVTVTGTSITASVIPTVTFTGGYIALDTQVVFPNPFHRLLTTAHIALRAQDEAWVATNNTLLKGQDRVYGGVGQVGDYDWPNPIRNITRFGPLLFPPRSVEAAVVVVGPPTAQPFANPRGPAFPSDLRGFVDPTEFWLLAPVTAPDTTNETRAPVFIRGWPEPASIDLGTWLHPTPIHLIGKDIVPGRAHGPNPRGVEFSANLRTHLQAVNIPLSQTMGSVNYDWPNPRGEPYPIDLRTFVNVPSSGLFVPIGRSADWVNPRGPLSSDTRGIVSSLNLNLQITPAAPFRQTDWPVPVIRWSLQGDPTPSAYIGLDTFFGAPGQVPTQKFENPRGPLYPTSLRTHIATSLGLTYVPAVAAPFNQIDWVNPRGAKFSPDLHAGSESPNLSLNVLVCGTWGAFSWNAALWCAGGAPLQPFDWPNPQRRQGIAAQIPPYPLTLTPSGPVAPPLRPLDWPNPLRLLPRSGPIHFRPKPGEDVVAAAVPAVPVTWVNPQRRRDAPPAWTQSYLLTTTLGGPVAPPLRPVDWPNPIRPGPRTAPLHFRPKPGEDVVVIPGTPFVPVSWPNPERLRDAFTAQIQPDSVVLFTSGTPLRPFDWPNPQRHGPRSAPLHFRPKPGEDVFVAPSIPSRPIDWPNPIRRGPPSAPLHFRPKPGVDVFVAPGAPFVPVTWANPARLRDALTAQIQPHRVAILPEAGPPFRPIDWPNPQRHKPRSGPLLLDRKRGQDVYGCGTWGAFSWGFATWCPTPTPPLQPLDWPNPLRHGPRSAPLHFRPKPGVDVVVIPSRPIVPIDWPNPTRRRDALTAQVQPQRVSFTGFDTVYGAPGQVPTHQFPNPRGARYPASLRTWANQINRPEGRQAPTYPFPNPRGPQYPISLRTWANQIKRPDFVGARIFGSANLFEADDILTAIGVLSSVDDNEIRNRVRKPLMRGGTFWKGRGASTSN